MKVVETVIRRCEEQATHCRDCVRNYQDLVNRIHRLGSSLPDADTVRQIMRDLGDIAKLEKADDDGVVIHNTAMMLNVCRGLCDLLVLAIVKERM